MKIKLCCKFKIETEKLFLRRKSYLQTCEKHSESFLFFFISFFSQRKRDTNTRNVGKTIFGVSHACTSFSIIVSFVCFFRQHFVSEIRGWFFIDVSYQIEIISFKKLNYFTIKVFNKNHWYIFFQTWLY